MPPIQAALRSVAAVKKKGPRHAESQILGSKSPDDGWVPGPVLVWLLANSKFQVGMKLNAFLHVHSEQSPSAHFFARSPSFYITGAGAIPTPFDYPVHDTTAHTPRRSYLLLATLQKARFLQTAHASLLLLSPTGLAHAL